MKKPGSILVVDDDDAVRQLFVTCLRREGYDVQEAATGQQGLHLAQTRSPELVLLDVRLPDISGVEVCRQIKTNPSLKDVFVVLCSGEATSVEHKVDGLHIGADEYLIKPFGINELTARVQTLMRLRNTTAALRVSEEHHRRLVDILPDAVCLFHPKGGLLSMNSQAAAMLGYAGSAELISKSIYDLTPPEEHERIRADFTVALKAGIIRNAEYTMLKKNGAAFRVELSATVLLGTGQSTGLLSVVRDITERKRAQQALQASEERFRQLAHHIREVFWMSNPARSEIIYVSPAYEEIWGQTCQSLYARPENWIAAVHPEDRKRVLDTLRQPVSGEQDEIYRIVRPDGTIRWIQDRAFPIRDEAGKIYRVVGIADDITKRKQAWDALGESEARKRAIMQAALDGIITIDHEGRMIELNSAAEKIFAHNRAKLIGENVLEVVPPSFRPWFKNGLDSCFAGQQQGPTLGSRIEMPALRADGSKFSAEFTITRIKLTGRPMFTIYIRDITQHKRAEAELRALPQKIIKAQEAERSRIARELHDGINQMIASVKMRLRKVETSLPDLKPAAREILSRCDQLLVKVLEENRRIAHNLRPTDLDNLGLAAACSSFCSEVQARTKMQVQCRIGPASLRLPPAAELHLFRIVQESVNNIEKHAQAGSVLLQMEVTDGTVSLKIQDDGRGFDVKNHRAGKKKGHGLGLSNMRERVLSLGGNYEIQSAPGTGTTVLVSIPLADPPKTPASRRAATPAVSGAA